MPANHMALHLDGLETTPMDTAKDSEAMDTNSESQREAAGTADEKPDGQAENDQVELPPNGSSESKKGVVGG